MIQFASVRQFLIKRANCSRDGFALVLALLGMALLLVAVLSATALLTVELRVTQSFRVRSQARFNAVAAARIALGELQGRLGRDQAVSFPFPPRPGWMAASRGTDASGEVAPAVPLVSGHWLLNTPKAAGLAWTELAPEEMFGGEKLPAVTVPWLRDDDGRRLAWWIEDESQKIDTGTREDEAAVPLDEIQLLRQLSSRRHPLDSLWRVIRGEPDRWRRALAQAPSWENLLLAWRTGAVEKELFLPHPRLHTRRARGVLSNTAEGGLRINWDQTAPLAPELLPCAPEAWHGFTEADPVFAADPAAGRPVFPSVAEVALRRFPILAGLRVRFGFFNTRSDGFHRARFTAEAQLWNPTPYPMLSSEAARIGLLDFEKMPTVTVLNRDTGGQIEVDMGAFPVGQFGLARQTVSDITANAWVEFYDGRRFGMDAPGLLAGEVFHFNVPNPVAQPQGLARVLSRTTWKMQSDPSKPSKPPSGANGNHWFHAAHRIRIAGTMPPDGVTLHIREVRGSFPSGITAAQYSAPALTLKNVPFANFSIELSGAEYNRATSTSYTAESARMAFTLRLRGDNPALLEEVFASLDPREPVLDFRDERVRNLYVVESDAAGVLAVPLPRSRTESALWDDSENDHEGGSAEAPFADVRALDFPVPARPLSAAALRHLPRSGRAAGGLSSRYPVGREEDAGWFDRAFFAGKWPEDGDPDVVRPWSRNPWLEPLGGADTAGFAGREDAAACCFVRGVFNVNSTDAGAWRTLLARVLPAWRRRGADTEAAPAPEKKDLENTLFRLPFGAAEPIKVGARAEALADEELRQIGPDLHARWAGMQGLRAVDAAVRDRLAGALADAIQRRQSERGPFNSLADFSLSGVIAGALREAEVNGTDAVGGPVPAVSPLRINPGDLLESLLPALAARGDTFKIRVRGGVFSPTGEALSAADAEMIVQRLPEFCESAQGPMTPGGELTPRNRHLGRRFRVEAWRWLEKDAR